MKQYFVTRKFLMVSIALIVALMLQLVTTPITARADDGTTPPSAEEQTEPTPPVEEEPSVSDLPENVDLVIVGADGQPEPLASQAAADAIANSDPFWCPEGTDPNSGGCTSYATFTALLTGLQGVSSLTNGTVYVQAGNYSGPESQVTFNGNTLTNIGNLNLIGGWNLVSGPYSQVGVTNFTVPVSIINWKHDVSVEDIKVNGANGSGLTIQTTGSASVTDVVANNNANNGVYVIAGDSIALNNVQADYNHDDGVDLRGPTNTGTVTLDNVQANHNTDDGIYIYTKARSNITLSQVTSDYNGGDGLHLENPREDVDCTFSTTYIPDGLFGPASPDGYSMGVYSGPLLIVVEKCQVKNENIFITASEFNNNGGDGIYANVPTQLGIGQPGNPGSMVYTNNNGGNGITINEFFNHDAFPYDYYQQLANTLNGGQPAQLMAGLGHYTGTYMPWMATANNNDGYGYVLDQELKAIGFCSTDYFERSGNGQGENSVIDNHGSVSCVFSPAGTPIVGGETFDLGFNPEEDSLASNTTATTSESNEAGSSKSNSKPLCAQNSIIILQLPNNDNVTIFCPISGQISVKSLGKKGLPGSVPDGATFVSSLAVNLLKHGTPTSVIEDEGHLKVSFAIPSDLAGKNFAILYWDVTAEKWVELPAFADNGGKAVVTDLADGKQVLEGTKVLADVGLVEVSVNFPGTFVLVVK